MKKHMKRSILFLFFFCFLVTLASSPMLIDPVGATVVEDTVGKEKAQELREERREFVQEQKDTLQEQRQETKTAIQEKRQETRAEIADGHAQRLHKRFSSYFDRLSTMISKIQERVTILANKGKDVSSAQEKIDEAEETLQNAHKLGEQAIAKFSSIDPAQYDEQRAVAIEAKDLAQKARQEYLKTLQLLKECVALLKKIYQN